MLYGDTVILGALVAADAQAMFSWFNDPAIARSNGEVRPTDGQGFTAWFNALGKDRSRVYFAIRARSDRRLLGYLTVLDIHPIFRSAELGLTIGAPADRGHGHGAEAVRLAKDYCWRHLDLQRLTMRVYGPNPAAVRCYQKAGFAVEGVLRRAAYFDGERVDITLMGALRLE